MPSFVVFAVVTEVLLSMVSTSTTREMSLTGKGLRRMAFTTVKMVVLAPIPSASDSTATVLNPGFFVSMRPAYRMSCHRVRTFLTSAAQVGSLYIPRTRLDDCIREVGSRGRMPKTVLSGGLKLPQSAGDWKALGRVPTQSRPRFF